MTPHDDPRLTRYALNEMTDAERVAFERELTDEDRGEVAAIRALAGTLTAQLNAEPMPIARRERPAIRRVLAIAAGIAVVGLFGASLMLPSLNRARESSRSGRAVSIALSEKSSLDARTPPATPATAGKDGQNVLYGNGHVEFQSGPFVGQARDNVFTARGRVGADASAAVATPSRISAGMLDRTDAKPELRRFYQASPFEANDSFLLPVDEDGDGTVDRKVAGGGGPGGGLAFRFADAREVPSADSYARIVENRFIAPIGGAAVSTFGVDVDTASYANVRRFLQNNQRPPANAVRIEELINYFPTSDAPPTDGRPFATYADVASCPWNASHQLVRVALKAREVAVDKRPPSNLVFLVDVSGSMSDADKLPLVKRGLQRLIDSLNEDDRVAIVVYAGNSGLVLPSTNAANKDVIRAAIDKLEAGGSTNGGQGIELAYATAVANFRAGGANRVILCTDGDFNVGVTDRGALVEMIQQKAKAGVFLSVFGFGRGNLKDDTMESLADKGNGQYAYVDSDREAHKVFVEQTSGTLVTVAKDVKVQVEFNPATVKSYRLIGYENRALKTEDFNNDLKDAGEIGAGHNVVALYEIEPRGSGDFRRHSEGTLKYQTTSAPAIAPDANRTELLTLKLRFKAPDAPLEQGVSELIERTLDVSDRTIDDAAPDFQFAAAVAGFGMMLRESPNRGELDWATVARLARAGVGKDVGGYRAEFIGLVDRAANLAPRPVTPAPAR